MASKKILVVAGEVSADQHGARVLKELRQLVPELSFFGIGGDEMAAEGMDIIFHLDQMAFLGVAEVLRHLPFIVKVRKRLLEAVKRENPVCALLIDYPGFNLRLAKVLKSMGIPVIYYISPQLWAWGKHRLNIVRRCVDRMLVLFPFEKKFYLQHGIYAHYVGHPLVDRHFASLPNQLKTVQPGKVTLGLLPGSRRNEIKNLLPRMLRTAEILLRENKVQRVYIARVQHLPENFYKEVAGELPAQIQWVQLPMEQLLPRLDLALVASGTVTLETAYYAVPMVIVYHVHWLTYWLGRMLIKLDHIGLANIVAEGEVAPELIQRDFTPERAASLLAEMSIPEVNMEIRESLMRMRKKLGEPGAAFRTAEAIVDFLFDLEDNVS